MPMTNPRIRRRNGSALVEFALMFSVMIWLLFGVLDMSRTFYTCSAVAGAAEAGVRYGLLSTGNNSDLAGMQRAALNDANISGATATASQFCTCSDGTSISCSGTCSSGQVRLYLQVTTAAPFFSFYPGFPATIQGQSRMRAK
jgi:Flp pilus assembly protein TadG